MTEQTQAPAQVREPFKQRLERLLREHGPVAIVVYFGLFFLTLAGFGIAMSLGFQVEGASKTAGIWVAAYGATQLTKPLRFLATFALTPLFSRIWRRVRAER